MFDLLPEGCPESIYILFNCHKTNKKLGEDLLKLLRDGEEGAYLALAVYLRLHYEEISLVDPRGVGSAFSDIRASLTLDESSKIKRLTDLKGQELKSSDEELLWYLVGKGMGGKCIVAQLLNNDEKQRYLKGDLNFAFKEIREKGLGEWPKDSLAIDNPLYGIFWGKIEGEKIEKWYFAGDLTLNGPTILEIGDGTIGEAEEFSIFHKEDGKLEVTGKFSEKYDIKQSCTFGRSTNFSDLMIPRIKKTTSKLKALGLLREYKRGILKEYKSDKKSYVLWGKEGSSRTPIGWDDGNIVDYNSFQNKGEIEIANLWPQGMFTQFQEGIIINWIEQISFRERRRLYVGKELECEPLFRTPANRKSSYVSWSYDGIDWQEAKVIEDKLFLDIKVSLGPRETGRHFYYQQKDNRIKYLSVGSPESNKWAIKRDIKYCDKLGMTVKENEDVLGIAVLDCVPLALWGTKDGKSLGWEAISCLAEISHLKEVGRKRLSAQFHKDSIKWFEKLLKEHAKEGIQL